MFGFLKRQKRLPELVAEMPARIEALGEAIALAERHGYGHEVRAQWGCDPWEKHAAVRRLLANMEELLALPELQSPGGLAEFLSRPDVRANEEQIRRVLHEIDRF